MSAILTVSDLNVSFGEEPIVKNLSLELNAGESLAILGPNGAGKTVFLRALLGIVPYRGEIHWAKNTRIGYVPQKIEADRHLPINLYNLLFAKAATLNIGRHEIAKVIATVGLKDKILDTPIGHLSGGEFQRALIAFAILGEPKVIILDEPTASIDKPGEEQTYELIHRLQDTYAMTVILVSHDLSFVYRYASKVLCLNHAGFCFGTPEEALTPAVLEKLYGSHRYYHHLHPHDKHNNV